MNTLCKPNKTLRDNWYVLPRVDVNKAFSRPHYASENILNLIRIRTNVLCNTAYKHEPSGFYSRLGARLFPVSGRPGARVRFIPDEPSL